MTAARIAPTPMRSISMGVPAPAPRAFLDFCQREPEECAAQAREGRQPAQAANRLFWDVAFAQAADRTGAWRGFGASTAAINPTLRPARLDWAQRFQSAQLVADEAGPGRSQDESDADETLSLPDDQGIVLSANQWSLVRKINAHVNRAIVRRSDDANSPSADVWSLPLHDGSGAGDCEDYVLEKRAALLEAGLPLSALSIAVVQTNWGETHAVLLLSTDKGEFVLDNLSPWVLEWEKAPYRWISRQQPGRTFQWMALTTAAPHG